MTNSIDKNNLVLIAKIKSAANDSGYLLISSFSDFPDRFFDLEDVYIEVFDAIIKLVIEDVSVLGDEIALKFSNFDSDEYLNDLIGCSLFVKKTDTVELPENTFFIHDLIGSKVFFNDAFFGELKEVYQLVSNDIYIIETVDGNEVLLPAIKDCIKSFDPGHKILQLSNNFRMYLESDEDDED